MTSPKRPHPVKSLRGPLILIAAAVVWSGAGAFYSSTRSNGDEFAGAGSVVAVLLFMTGLVLTFNGSHKND